MTHDWFILRNGKETGPFTVQQVKDMAAKQKLGPDDLVRRGDMQTPKKASSIKGLFPEVTSAVRPATATPKAKSMKLPLILGGTTAGVLLLACCGGLGLMAFLGNKMEKVSRAELAEADALWDKGDKAGGAGKYRGILVGHRVHFLKEEDRPRLYGRLIDFEYENGHADAGKALIDKADKENITPAVGHVDAKKALAALQAEKARVEAEKRRQAEEKAKAEAAKKTKEKGTSEQDANTFSVSKGLFSGSMQVRVLVPDEITISDLSFDDYELKFKLHWKRSIGRPVDPWHYSAYDKDGVKVDGGAVGIPDSMELGQKIKARIVLNRDNVKEITRIDIHQ